MGLGFWVRQERHHRETAAVMQDALKDADIVSEVKLRKKIRFHKNEHKNCLYQVGMML